MVLLKTKRVLAAKIETTAGTAIAVDADDGKFNIFDADIQMDIPIVERPGQGSRMALKSVTGKRMGIVKFKIEIHGSGTADAGGGEAVPQWAKTFLPACSWVAGAGADLNVYTPLTQAPGSSCKTLTIYVWEDGLKKGIAGAMGTWVVTCTDGEQAYIEFEFKGKWIEPTAEAIIAPDYPSIIPPRFAGATTTMGSHAPRFNELKIDMGNEVNFSEDPADSTGIYHAIITAGVTTGTCDMEDELIASGNKYSEFLTACGLAFSCQWGTAGNSITLWTSGAGLQWTALPEGDRDGKQTINAAFAIRRVIDAGDDGPKIEFL